ncbi:MAG: DUF3737 family protein [Paludibacteraceae bacterium]|nr:DUF3737 family protein [Paludibacteraceae bacterium]
MKTITHQEFGGERPLYKSEDMQLRQVTIHAGESSLKECRRIEAEDCRFEGKYVFWENEGVVCRNCYFAPSARSSVWYSRNIRYQDCRIDAPKMFRRAHHIALENVEIAHGEETFWDCSDVQLKNVKTAEADYLFMHTTDIRIEDYRQDGNYSFQYAKRVEIRNTVINSKDSFWESEDCTLTDCEINGEYLGWYAKRLRLVRCHITGTQPLCYCEDLVLEDCTFGDDADLAMEYSTVQAVIRGRIHSIKNPTSGNIYAEEIGELIMDQNQKQPADCKINYDRICKPAGV